jgi:hypothetical protein
MDVLVTLIALLVALGLYFLPTVIAAVKKSRQTTAIFALNLLLGWTLLGWVAALVWSLINTGSDPAAGS